MSEPTAELDKDSAALLASLERGLQQVAEDDVQRHTSAQIAARRRGRPPGSVQAVTKEAVKLRLDADVLAALRASGEGWQTRINDALRASLRLTGKVSS
ncbi:BrnA antitoxin family protein [Amphibiibacter pelophylacis]|uniref:BrnA antitoxin family protein n=1 Tax=Amphibiibacter pelophylacis TaxID=1799477 RepID=A0ACC6NYR6_9BURK